MRTKKNIRFYPGMAAICCLFLLRMVSPAVSAPINPHFIVPEREIIFENHAAPEWKLIWDDARRLIKNGNYIEAVDLYQSLLLLKKDLHEASWELARLLMHLQKWEEAVLTLELLIEADPQRVAYLNSLGRVMWETGRFDRAVDLFGRAYEKNPEDQTALAGLVEGLIKLDRKKDALPLLDHLHRLQPDNVGVQRYLALLAFDLKLYQKARDLLVELADNRDADQELLLRAAQVHDRLGLVKEAVPYWQRLVEREPAQVEANTRLADFYEVAGRPVEALPYLLVLHKNSPADGKLLFRLGRIYEKQGELTLALSFYERYLAQDPAEHDVLRSIIKIQAALGHRKQTLAAIEHYFAVDDDSDPADLKLAARLYDAAGRYSKAIPIYRQLIDISPDDPEVLAALASDLLAIGENEGALSIWRHLAGATPGQLSIYRAMVGLLERLDRKDELFEILTIINRLDPADEDVTLRLANLYRERGAVSKALVLYERLAASGHASAEFFQGRGQLYVSLRMPALALADFEALLALQPELTDIRRQCLQLAGLLGRLSVAQRHADVLSVSPIADNGEEAAVSADFEVRFLMANVFVETGFWQDALREYRLVIDHWQQMKTAGHGADVSNGAAAMVVRARLGMAEAYLTAGLEYEAERSLRMALVRGEQAELFDRALFDLALSAGRVGEGAVWLDDLEHNDSTTDDGQGEAELPGWRRKLMESRLLAARGSFTDAILLCQQLFAALPVLPAAARMPPQEYSPGAEEAPRLTVGIVLCHLLVDSGRLSEATKVAATLRREGWDNLEIFVLLRQIYQRGGDYPLAREANTYLMNIADDGRSDVGTLLRLAELYESYADISAMITVSRAAYQQSPDSLRALFFLAAARERLGQLDEALQLYGQAAREYPGNSRATSGVIRLMFKTGQFDGALERCEKLLVAEPERYEIILLKARILWALNRWREALAVYEEVLALPVREQLVADLQGVDVDLQLLPEKSFWDKVTFSDGGPPDLLKVMMSPVFLVGGYPADRQVKEIAVNLFARVRWQQRLNRELAARKSVQRREYNQAAKQYEDLLVVYGADESLLFDLAGIYSRLGSLGKETILYDQLQALNPQFPGLNDVVRRNRMKRRPQISLGYGWSEDDGWQGYRAIRNQWQESSLWLSPRSGQEFVAQAVHRRYQSTDMDRTVWAKRAMLTYRAILAEGMLASVGGGVETLDYDSIATAVFDCSLQGTVGDSVKGRLGYQRDVTADTMASLTRNIVRQGFEAALTVDFFPRLTLEGDFGFTDFSDGNHRSNYGFSSAYTLLFSPTYLRVSYSYGYENSRFEANPGVPQADGFARDDHPYWSPSDYWLNRFSLFFKHNLSDDTLDRGVPTYYTLEYSLGHDSRDHELQAFKSGFFWEWNEHFIVRATADFLSMKNYQSKEVFLAGIYRW